jgi:hypothetical protein
MEKNIPNGRSDYLPTFLFVWYMIGSSFSFMGSWHKGTVDSKEKWGGVRKMAMVGCFLDCGDDGGLFSFWTCPFPVKI